MLKILIVDDHPVFRTGLTLIPQAVFAELMLSETRDGQAALAKVRAEPWDLVLLDISLPDQSGLKVLGAIKREHPRLPVLMLSLHRDRAYIERSLQLGQPAISPKRRPGQTWWRPCVPSRRAAPI
jgi:DNA-binding NarL/FixJ family response regulator